MKLEVHMTGRGGTSPGLIFYPYTAGGVFSAGFSPVSLLYYTCRLAYPRANEFST